MTVKNIAIKKITNQKLLSRPKLEKQLKEHKIPSNSLAPTASLLIAENDPNQKQKPLDLSYETKKLLDKINNFQLNETQNNNTTLATNDGGQLELDLSDEEEEEIVKAMRGQSNDSSAILANRSKLTTITSLETKPLVVDAYEQTAKLLSKIKETRERSASKKTLSTSKSTVEFLNQRSLTKRTNSNYNNKTNSNYNKLASRIPKLTPEPISKIYRTKSTTDAFVYPTVSTVSKSIKSNNNRTTTINSTNQLAGRRGKSVVIEDTTRKLTINPRYFASKLVEPTNFDSIKQLEFKSKQNIPKNNKANSNDNDINTNKNNSISNDLIDSLSLIDKNLNRTSRLRLISNQKNYDLDKPSSNNSYSIQKKANLFQKRNQTSTPHPLITHKLETNLKTKEQIATTDSSSSSSSSSRSSRSRSRSSSRNKREMVEEGEGTITLNFDLPNDIDPSAVNVLLDENNENLIIESSDKKDNYYIISLPKNAVFDDLEYSVEKLEENNDKDIISNDKEEREDPSLNLELSMNIDLAKEIDPSKIRVTLNEDNIIVESKELNHVIYAVSLPENTDFDRMEYSLEKLDSLPTNKKTSTSSVKTSLIPRHIQSKNTSHSTSSISTSTNDRQFKKIQI